MTTRDLIALEEGFWRGGIAYYREHLDDDALMVFAEPVGVLNKTATIHAVSSAPRWARVEFEDVRTIEMSPGTALLVYRAEAEQEDGTKYVTLASSAYVERDGAWRLLFHQQTSG